MKVLVCLALVWLGVAHGKSLPYHSSEELYWGDTFNTGPYFGHSSEEHRLGWDDFGPGGVWDNTNRRLGTAWNSVYNTDFNTNWGTDRVNSNNNGMAGETPSVDSSVAPDLQEVSGGQEVVTEANVPAEDDVTTKNWLGWNDFGRNGGWDDAFSRGHYPSHSSEEHWLGWNGFGRGGAWDNTNRRLGTAWNSVYNTDFNTNLGTDWMNSNNAADEQVISTVNNNNAPDGQDVSVGQEVVTEANVPSESDVTTSSNVIGNDVTTEGGAPIDVNADVSFDDVVLPETETAFERLRGERN